MSRANVEYRPQTESGLVVLKPCWSADNGHETAVFPTKAEAIEFCWKRWRVPADQVHVTSSTRKTD